MGGGGGGGGVGSCEVQKKYLRKGKLNEKNSCTPINPKKYSCFGLKKYSYKESDNEKKFLRLENSPPPHNFSNGPSLLTSNNGTVRIKLKVYNAPEP